MWPGHVSCSSPVPVTDTAKEGQAGGDLPKVTQRTGRGQRVSRGAVAQDPPYSPVAPLRKGVGTEGP